MRTLCQLNAIDPNHPKYTTAVNNLLDQRSKVSLHRRQTTSAYLRYQNVRALLAVVESGLVPEGVKGSGKIGYALERSNMVSGVG